MYFVVNSAAYPRGLNLENQRYTSLNHATKNTRDPQITGNTFRDSRIQKIFRRQSRKMKLYI